MGIFFSCVFLGLSLAAPIGPVNAAQMDKGIKHGFIMSISNPLTILFWIGI